MYANHVTFVGRAAMHLSGGVGVETPRSKKHGDTEMCPIRTTKESSKHNSTTWARERTHELIHANLRTLETCCEPDSWLLLTARMCQRKRERLLRLYLTNSLGGFPK
jgi:hypothetical protein